MDEGCDRRDLGTHPDVKNTFFFFFFSEGSGRAAPAQTRTWHRLPSDRD